MYKLAIKGIRSFEPEQEETIQFGAPITLICGQNGCGKTTIIECLKYATTGDLPPNSKGGAFVNDPSLTGRTNVTGQVKLAFRNANGQSMIATRTVQLSKKKARGSTATTNTFKTLEGQLAVIDKGGQKTSISSKNAELDTQIPIYLGASRAILDNVIFCHQDDSLWPLSEPLLLKKRFDDIFEASKFTKVLENLKVIKKDMNVDIKLIEGAVAHLKIDKDRARNIREELDGIIKDLELFNQLIVLINFEIEAKEKEADELFSLNQDFQTTLNEFDRLNYEGLVKTEQIERLKGSIELLDSLSDQELLYRQQNFATITSEKETALGELSAKSDTLSGDIQKGTKDHNELIRLDGSLKAAEADFNANVTKLKDIIFSNDFDYAVGNYDFHHFKNALQQRFNRISKDLKQLKDLKSEEHNLRSAEYQKTLDAITKESQNLINLNNNIKTNNEKVNTLQKKLNAADDNEAKLRNETAQLKILKEDLQNIKNLKEIKTLEVKIADANSKLLKLEYESEDLSNKVVLSNKQADLTTRITMKTEAIETKKLNLTNIISTVQERFEAELGRAFDVETSRDALKEKLDSLVVESNNLERRHIKASTDAESSDSLIKSSIKKKEQYESQLNSVQLDILKVLEKDEIDIYETILDDLETSHRNVTEDVNTSEVTKQFNLTAIKIATELHKCFLCNRGFEETGLSLFINELKKNVKEDHVKEIAEQAASITKDLQEMKSLNPKILLWRDLKVKISEINEKLDELDLELETFNSEAEALNDKINKDKIIISKLTSLQLPLSDISRINLEISELTKELQTLVDELGDFGVVAIPINELQKMQQQKTNEIKLLRQEISGDVDAKHTAHRKISELENKVKDIELSISNLEKSLGDITNVKQQIVEAEEALEELTRKKAQLLKQVGELNAEKTSTFNTLTELKQQDDLHIKEKEESLSRNQKVLENYINLYVSTSTFETEGKVKLEENNSNLEAKSKEISELQSQLESYQLEVKTLEKSVSESSKEEHNVLSNLDYRRLIVEMDKISDRIQELDIANARVKRDEFQERSKTLRNEISTLRSQHDGKTGELKQMSDQIKRLQSLLTTEYESVNELYHKEWVKLQTNMLISNDIETYSKALDNAIMKYHSIKMTDINRILRALWSLTYKGTDIETIAIKSDVNVQAKGNRSYNYRVVMYKSGNELDMRGRCSAGQKVLTSILIRLALAECFGVNCGMIALDEPTTNLDQENSESLAEALNEIISVRKLQVNFQLIVITHDENFLTHINGGKFTDHFYRVHRDEQQSSRIQGVPISKMH